MKFLIAIFVTTLFAKAFCIKMQCSISSYPNWNVAIPVTSYKPIGFSTENRNETITSIEGIINSEAKAGLVFESIVVYFIPKGIEKFIPNLIALKVYNSQLKSITKSDLQPFGKLEELILESNNLEILEGDLFEFNPKLKYLNFNSNKLKYIGSQLLTPLKQITHARFLNNICVNTYYQKSYHHPDLTSTFESSCSLSTNLKEEICIDDVTRLEEEFAGALVELSAEHRLETERLKALLDSSEKNLNAATMNMMLLSKQLEACAGIENKEMFDEPMTKQKLIEIECNLKDATTCTATDLQVEFKNSIIFQVKNSEASKITALIVRVQKTLFLPLGLENNFENLEKLEVTDSGLYELDKSVLASLFQLTSLNLTRNKLRKIAEDSFEDLTALLELDMSFNNIQSLQPGLFKTLSNLFRLDLQSNLLVTINVEVMESLSSLKELFLQKNSLKFISANLLAPLASIELVDLTNNTCIDMRYPEASIKELDIQIIDNCIAPVELDCINDLNLTKYADIEKRVCSAKSLTVDYPKTKIKNVLLADNDEAVTVFVAVNQSMKFIPYQLGSTLPNVTKIVIESSGLTTLLKHEFEGFTQLKTLIIQHNNLTKIEENAFDEATQLETLDLTFNNIRSLPPKVFLHLVRLKNLILSNNLIESFTADLLPRKNAIEEFWVDHNELEIIETKTLRFLRKAKIIDLTGNVCIDLKFDRNDAGSKTLVELSGEIDLNCSADDI